MVRALLIICLFLVLLFGCGNPEKKLTAVDLDSRVNDLDSYERSWLRYQDDDGETLRMLEMYVSMRGDTVYGQQYEFKGGQIDTLQSVFYDLAWSWSKDSDSLLKGSVKLHVPSSGDGMVSSKFYLTLYQPWRDSLFLPSFEVKNKNEIEFEFFSNSDAVVGGLMYYKFTDNGKVENGEDLLDVFEVWIPVANREKAYNFFISTFNEDSNE